MATFKHTLKKLRFEKDGFQVFSAGDGITALGIVSTEKLDCAILDVMMPELNGFQLLKKIREKTNIRRYHSASAETGPVLLKAGPLELNTEKCLLYKKGSPIEITSTEFRVLQLFMTNPNRVYTKAQISAAGWGENTYVEDNSIMVTLSKLRTKLGAEGWIKNIRGL